MTEGYATRKRRRFRADFKAKVALEALRGDTTVQKIAAKHQVHPSQVSAWKRQSVDGLGAVFSNGGEAARRDHEAESMIGKADAVPKSPRAQQHQNDTTNGILVA
ncbi:MAG: hypothetical protein EA405_11240 [Rhodospirillales bacterium]|nr:MAG: hypothetical protein EA405_11240 [Rhodospirillales bacterium]